ncbi:Uncharacterised protein [Mycobacteroides abscessus subsp. abscessus]|nr:Uncharacterised protein [Mycobacteroides abscessus subsp. abscessus]
MLRTSAAVMPEVGSIRMSSGASQDRAHRAGGRQARLPEGIGDAVVSGVHQGDSLGEGRQPLPGQPQRLGVAVEADQP